MIPCGNREDPRRRRSANKIGTEEKRREKKNYSNARTVRTGRIIIIIIIIIGHI